MRHYAIPAPLNMKSANTTGPKFCTSVNEVVCHGIPDDTVLKDGDIINVDVASIFQKRGYYGDTSATFYIGEPAPTTKHICRDSSSELGAGYKCDQGLSWRYRTCHSVVAEAKGALLCVSIRARIGRVFHGPPNVLHYGRPGQGQTKG